jgi:hypothetical protein
MAINAYLVIYSLEGFEKKNYSLNKPSFAELDQQILIYKVKISHTLTNI